MINWEKIRFMNKSQKFKKSCYWNSLKEVKKSKVIKKLMRNDICRFLTLFRQTNANFKKIFNMYYCVLQFIFQHCL